MAGWLHFLLPKSELWASNTRITVAVIGTADLSMHFTRSLTLLHIPLVMHALFRVTDCLSFAVSAPARTHERKKRVDTRTAGRRRCKRARAAEEVAVDASQGSSAGRTRAAAGESRTCGVELLHKVAGRRSVSVTLVNATLLVFFIQIQICCSLLVRRSDPVYPVQCIPVHGVLWRRVRSIRESRDRARKLTPRYVILHRQHSRVSRTRESKCSVHTLARDLWTKLERNYGDEVPFVLGYAPFETSVHRSSLD